MYVSGFLTPDLGHSKAWVSATLAPKNFSLSILWAAVNKARFLLSLLEPSHAALSSLRIKPSINEFASARVI